MTTPCPILAAQKAQADEARAIIRRRLGPDPAYDAAVAAWLERNRGLQMLPAFAHTKQQISDKGGPR